MVNFVIKSFFMDFTSQVAAGRIYDFLYITSWDRCPNFRQMWSYRMANGTAARPFPSQKSIPCFEKVLSHSSILSWYLGRSFRASKVTHVIILDFLICIAKPPSRPSQGWSHLNQPLPKRSTQGRWKPKVKHQLLGKTRSAGWEQSWEEKPQLWRVRRFFLPLFSH